MVVVLSCVVVVVWVGCVVLYCVVWVHDRITTLLYQFESCRIQCIMYSMMYDVLCMMNHVSYDVSYIILTFDPTTSNRPHQQREKRSNRVARTPRSRLLLVVYRYVETKAGVCSRVSQRKFESKEIPNGQFLLRTYSTVLHCTRRTYR
jgi:uncharacterized DUF497 family protein